VVSGTVHKLNHFGAFVYLDRDIHGLAHISEMSEAYPGKNLEELLKTGEAYSWKILSIEPKEHRMGLVLTSKKEKKENSDKADKIESKKETATSKKEAKKNSKKAEK
jgi:small subunit ribosomal protein S1